MNNYYKRFQLISHLPFWRAYLHWAYKQGIADLEKLNLKPDFESMGFTCLMCGVSGEVTADEFIKLVLSKNDKSRIIIIDLGEEQVNSIRNLVDTKYKSKNIKVFKANALELGFINKHSIDWIETDGFLEYFDEKNLVLLLKKWKVLLKPNGFITTRDFASQGTPGKLIDLFRIWIGKEYLGVILNSYTKNKLENIFLRNDYSFVSGLTPFPTYRRYTLIKR